jgi:hypothetical protein
VPPDSANFELSAGEMRALGYRVIDMLVEHHTALGEKSATTVKRRGCFNCVGSRSLAEESSSVVAP